MKDLIIDIRPLLPKNPPSGVPEYTRELLQAMLEILQHKPQVRVFLFSSGSQIPSLEYFKDYQQVFTHYHVSFPNKLLNASLKMFSFPQIDRLIKNAYNIPLRDRFIIFAPNINLMALSPFARLALTFHDLSFERYPFFLRGKDAIWHRLVNPRALAIRASRIIAVSESTKRDLVNLYGVEPRKITVIYSGAGEEFRPATRDKQRTTNEKRVVYLGSLEGRKNIEVLTQAFEKVKKRLPNQYLKLVLAGPPGNPIAHEKRVEFYQRASVFVYPSIFEGFGLPPLEAMKCGVPVITSHTSSLPEAVGGAAITVNPHRVYELAAVMEALLTDERLRAHYVKKGLERARQFRWEKAAKATLNVLLS